MYRETTTPTPARVPPARRWAGGAIAALACVAFVSACGSSKSSTSSTATSTHLDIARVQRSIEQSILTQRHLTSTVVCPATEPQEAGKTFECVATTHTTTKPVKVGKTVFLVTEHNSKGYVTYEGK